MKNIVIIGAGLGGLTTGALLAKDGYSVTILEQHSIVGGCATVFKRKGGFTCEVGLHEMDGVYTNPNIVDIFNKLDVYNNIDFIKIDEFFEIKTKDLTFLMPEGVSNAKDALIDTFPHQKDALIQYFELIKNISTKMEKINNLTWKDYLLFPFLFATILKYKDKNTTEVFDKIFTDEKLKLVLNANVNYYNDTPDSLSFLMHSVAQYSYFNGSGHFIKGGSGQLSDYLASVIKKYGGEVLTNAEVINATKDSIEYIHKKEKHSIKYDKVVSNLSPEDTYKLFKVDYEEKREIANSLLTIYLGFSKNLKSVYGKRAYSNFYFNNITSLQDLRETMKKDIFNRPFIFVDYSQIDSNLTKENSKSFGSICLVDRYEDWDRLTKEEYKRRKEKVLNTFLDKLECEYSGIKSLIEYAEVGTAKTVKRYIKTPQGTAYGFKPTPKNFFKLAKTKSKKVDNLYFVGQWILAGGFSPAIMSGKICFEDIKK